MGRSTSVVSLESWPITGNSERSGSKTILFQKQNNAQTVDTKFMITLEVGTASSRKSAERDF